VVEAESVLTLLLDAADADAEADDEAELAAGDVASVAATGGADAACVFSSCVAAACDFFSWSAMTATTLVCLCEWLEGLSVTRVMGQVDEVGLTMCGRNARQRER